MTEHEESFEQMIGLSEAITDFIEEAKKRGNLYNSSITGALLLTAKLYNIASKADISLSETIDLLDPMFDEIIQTKQLQ